MFRFDIWVFCRYCSHNCIRLFLVSILPIGSNLNVHEWTPWCFGWCRFPLCFQLWQLSPATKAKYLSWYEMEGPVKPKTGKQARYSQWKWGGQLVPRLPWVTAGLALEKKDVHRCIHLPKAMLPCRALTRAGCSYNSFGVRVQMSIAYVYNQIWTHDHPVFSKRWLISLSVCASPIASLPRANQHDNIYGSISFFRCYMHRCGDWSASIDPHSHL